MKIELGKEDLISLVKGTTPNYSEMNDALIEKFGGVTSSNGRWEWSSITLQECNEEELYKIYKSCKNSWSE